MWGRSFWPVLRSLYRIERKVDHMSAQSEKLKQVLDAIAGHVTGLKSGIDAMQANLAAALKAAADNNQKSDPLLDAALSEATDLSDKLAAMEEALKPHVEVPQPVNPNPPADPNAPAPATDPAPAPTGDPAADPNAQPQT